MVDYVSTPTATTANAKAYDPSGQGYTIEAVEVPDMANLIDTVEEGIMEALEADTPLREIALNLIQATRLELLSELLLKLLLIFQDSDNIKLDTAILISCAGLPLSSKTDTQIAKEHGVIKQTFSARKRALLDRLQLATPPASKSDKACASYALMNRKNTKPAV